MTAAASLSRLGFVTARLRIAWPSAFGACLALALAAELGLEHPQWSAMTVWAAYQPSRGQLLEKGFFRLAGTVSGVLAGVFLVLFVHVADDQRWLLVAGLALWIGACAAIGNLQRGFVAYGTMLAGYSAAMVALLDTAHPERVIELGVDRLTTVVVGVVVALVIGGIFASAGGGDRVAARVDAASAALLRALAGRRRPDRAERATAAARALSEIAEIDEELDPHGAGSLRSRRLVRSLRGRLIAQVAGHLMLHASSIEGPPDDLAALLREIADRLERPDRGDDFDRLLEAALAGSAGRPRLLEVLGPLFAAMRADPGAVVVGTQRRRRAHGPLVVLHRDWVGARRAFVRAVATMVAVGALWIGTDWSGGSFLLLGTAIMTSLFSTFDNPAQFMRNVLSGQVLGAIGALACSRLVWPHVDGEAGRILAMMPFILLGVAVFAHRRTAPAGFDYNMVVLLLLQPIEPPSGTLLHALALSGAVAAAPIAGWLSYRLVFPVEPRRRLVHIATSMVHDLAAMARESGRPTDREIWRRRLYHRLLRAIRWAEKSGGGGGAIVEAAVAVLDVGSAILRLREIRAEPGLLRPVERALDVAVARGAAIAASPERFARALDEAARRLAAVGRREDAERLADAAAALRTEASFFRAPGRAGARAEPPIAAPIGSAAG